MILEPATPLDLADLLTAGGPGVTVPAHVYRCLQVQVTASDAWTAREAADTAPVAIGGIFWFGDRPSEAWLLARAGGLGGDLLGVVLRARRLLREHGAAPPGLICRVTPGNAEGQRLATALGFVGTGIGLGGLRIWRYGDEQGSRRPVRRRPAGEAQAPAGGAGR